MGRDARHKCDINGAYATNIYSDHLPITNYRDEWWVSLAELRIIAKSTPVVLTHPPPTLYVQMASACLLKWDIFIRL